MFKQRKHNCFICSVANLLIVKYNDIDNAEKFYKNAAKHPAVMSDMAVSPYAMPEIFYILLGRNYSGVLYAKENLICNDLEVLERMKIMGWDMREAEHLKASSHAADSALNKGLVKLLGEFRGSTPYVACFKTSETNGHAVVDNGKYIIDKGIIKRQKPEKIDYIFHISRQGSLK